MKKLLVITICLFGLSSFAKAQMLNLNYQIGLPLGDIKDFTSKASFRGMDLEYHYFLNERFSIGAAIGWNVYYDDKDNVTQDFTFSESEKVYTISGHQFRYINTIPMLAIGRYYTMDKSKPIRPYIGVGIGSCWTEKRLELGQFASTISRWQFQVSPEIGMYAPVSDQFAFNFSARYNYGTKAAGGDLPAMQSIVFSIGIIMMGF